jgi:hypothetical protein
MLYIDSTVLFDAFKAVPGVEYVFSDRRCFCIRDASRYCLVCLCTNGINSTAVYVNPAISTANYLSHGRRVILAFHVMYRWFVFWRFTSVRTANRSAEHLVVFPSLLMVDKDENVSRRK